jgi:hypothetical protein
LRLVIGLIAGVAAAIAPGVWLKSVLVAGAAAVLATVATGYCPLNAILNEPAAEPQWRTLKIFRVEP